MNFPSSIPVKIIDAKHSEWRKNYRYWEHLRKLYEGGKTIRENAAEFLFRRSKEPEEVYGDRVARFTYTNHYGNICGWYEAALFKQPPRVLLRSATPTGMIGNGVLQEGEEPEELTDFEQNCDGNGRSLVELWREEIIPKVLTYREAFLLFDLPEAPEFSSLAQQREAGALKPYVRCYSPQDVVNWQTDAQGKLEWMVLKVRATTQDDPFTSPTYADRWYVFTQNEVALYEYALPKDQQGDPMFPIWNIRGSDFDYGSDKTATLQAGYPRPHALSDQGIVPIFIQSIHRNHWIADRVAQPLIKLLNLENAHDWALEQTNLAWLVICSGKEMDAVTRSETAYMQLDQGDSAEYLEQSGKGFDASQVREETVKEDTYRLAYLVAQGRASTASATTQSGVSKEQDMLPARDVLSALGDATREGMQRVLQAAAASMGLPVKVSVTGLDFPDRSDIIDIEIIERLTTVIDIQSPLFEKALQKWGVRLALPDEPKEVWTAIDKQIDANLTPSELQQQQLDQANSMKLQMASKLAAPRQFSDAVQAA